MLEESIKNLFNYLLNADLVGYLAFGILLVYTFKKNDERENRYLLVIDRLTKKLSVIDSIKISIEDIKKSLEEK